MKLQNCPVCKKDNITANTKTGVFCNDCGFGIKKTYTTCSLVNGGHLKHLSYEWNKLMPIEVIDNAK